MASTFYDTMAEAAWGCLLAYHKSLGHPPAKSYAELSDEDRDDLKVRCFWALSTQPKLGGDPLTLEEGLWVAVCRSISNTVAEAEAMGLGIYDEGLDKPADGA